MVVLDISKNNGVYEMVTTIKLNSETRTLLENLKIIPEETADHAVMRALKKLQESQEKGV